MSRHDNHLGPFTENGQTYIDGQPGDCGQCLRPLEAGHHGCNCEPDFDEGDDDMADLDEEEAKSLAANYVFGGSVFKGYIARWSPVMQRYIVQVHNKEWTTEVLNHAPVLCTVQTLTDFVEWVDSRPT